MNIRRLVFAMTLGMVICIPLHAAEPLSAQSLVQETVHNELHAHDNTFWAYKYTRLESGHMNTHQAIETNDVILSRLIAIDGQPLTQERRREDDARIDRLVNDLTSQIQIWETVQRCLRHATLKHP